MIKKPELLATARSLDEVKRLIRAGADAVLVGEHRYGLRLPGDMSAGDIAEAVRFARAMSAKVYVSVNKIFENDELDGLALYLQQMQQCDVDAIVFGDPAILVIMKELGIRLNLHWSTEMTSTNYATANYWALKGAKRVVAARELNMEEIHELKRRADIEVQVQVHGLTNIYHSNRRLLRSYSEHIGNDGGTLGAEEGFYLIEHERPELHLPIYEDPNGTHIMSADDLCMLDVLDELLEEPIDSLKIEGLLKSVEYHETAVRSYRQAIDAYCENPQQYTFREEWLEAIRLLQDSNRELSYGFFFKEQVY